MTKKPYSRKKDVHMKLWAHLDNNDSSSASEYEIEEVKNDEEQVACDVEEVKKDEG